MHMKLTAWVGLVCVILLAGACSDDAPVSEPEKETTARQPEPRAREWYPTPKHARPRIVISPAQAPVQMPMTQQPSFNAAPVTQQPWSPLPQQPYAAPQQYPYANPYQYNQRPWGSVPANPVHKQTETRQNSVPQGTATDYWGRPVYRGGQYYYP